MNLTVEAQEALQKYLDDTAAQQEMARKIKLQTEVFSNALIQERLFNPSTDAMAPFIKAWSPFAGGPSIHDSYRVVAATYAPHHFLIERTVYPPAGDLQAIFDAFLQHVDEHTYMGAVSVVHSRRWRVGKIALNLTITCEVPCSYRDLLRSMGVIRTQSPESYETLSCSFL